MIKELQIALLKEKIEKLTNKKVILEDYITPDALVYPKEIIGLLAQSPLAQENISSFELESVEKLILKAMVDGKIVTRKDLDLFLQMYSNNIKNRN